MFRSQAYLRPATALALKCGPPSAAFIMMEPEAVPEIPLRFYSWHLIMTWRQTPGRVRPRACTTTDVAAASVNVWARMCLAAG
jgi:hypothetical protein